MKILVTGCYGFLGHHVCARLIADGHDVIGTDRLSTAISEKGERIKALGKTLRFVEVDLADYGACRMLMLSHRPEVVIHLAAQFPIRHCAPALESYVSSNVSGWLHVVEAARDANVRRVLYASSVVAFGRPSSIYAATKGFNDLAAHVYAHQFDMTMIGLRYAAVYGPRIRPDSVTYRIAQQMLSRCALPAPRLNSGTCMVEIDEAVECTVRLATAELAVGARTFLVAADDERAAPAHVALALAPYLRVDPIWPPKFTPKPRDGRPDLTPLRQAIDFVPQITMQAGMEKFARWLLSKKS